MAKAALGRGLGALIQAKPVADVARPVEPGERVELVPLSSVRSSPLQPRTSFSPEKLEGLIDSIREKGIVQPLIVRRVGDHLELIAGERRWRAAEKAGRKEVPVIVREASDCEVLETALVENLQRADLNPIEEAQAYARLAGEFTLKQDEIARKVGKNRATVANTMRLLDLPEEIRGHLVHGRLTVGHAKAILALPDATAQRLAAEIVLRKGLSVRATEAFVKERLAEAGPEARRSGGSRGGRTSAAVEPAVLHLQNRLQQHLSTRVVINHRGGKGHILIEYYGNDDLQRLLGELGLTAE